MACVSLQEEPVPNQDSDALYAFSDDSGVVTEAMSPVSAGHWQVLIVDDEPGVHEVTRLVLSPFVFEGKSIQLHSAYNEAQAIQMLNDLPDLCLIILDVVMDQDNTGLKMVRYIREILHNSLVRIIMRTGQPGIAPEKDVIVNYDINDYKLKTELTADQLFVSVVSALRSYRDLHTLYYSGKGMQKVLEYSAFLFQVRYLKEISSGILMQLAAVIHMDQGEEFQQCSAFFASQVGKRYRIEAGFGQYENRMGEFLEDADSAELLHQMQVAIETQRNLYTGHSVMAALKSKFGMVNIISFRSNRVLGELERNLIDIFCANVTIALDNVYLGNEIDLTQREILFTLGEVAEARSREMGNHVKRVAEYSKQLALLAGLTEEEAEVVRMAAPIHDVGKLAIPDDVLNKPGKLNAYEFSMMKTHSVAGYDMLKASHSPILKAAAIIAVQHHERYDGKGYPDGLMGQGIHIYGRIVAITDVFDALGSQRVYKEAWSLPEILDYMREQQGKQFDPVLTDIFLDHLEEFLVIRDNFPD